MKSAHDEELFQRAQEHTAAVAADRAQLAKDRSDFGKERDAAWKEINEAREKIKADREAAATMKADMKQRTARAMAAISDSP